MTESPRTRTLTVIAQDPSFRDSNGRIVLEEVAVPAERLWPGPMGHRVHVIDYDATTDTLYKSAKAAIDVDPYAKYLVRGNVDRLIKDPQFHQQNVYAIVMETLGRFEYALGRRVPWGFAKGSHQIKVVPHAFEDANAFYSRNDEALLFGYFTGASGVTVFSCLSRDVVVHEATHALLDGLRNRFLYPSSPDQAAFHEGFSDVVALLSVFRLPRVLDVALGTRIYGKSARVQPQKLTHENLRGSVLLKLAEQMGQELAGVRGHALRQSLQLKPPVDLEAKEFLQAHRRGEVFVAAMLNAFVGVWVSRLKELATHRSGGLDRDRVIEEGVEAADRLLHAAIRAIDYCPPVDLTFGDYLSALLTADSFISPDDHKYRFRQVLRHHFEEFSITPESEGTPIEPGIWREAPRELSYDAVHFDSMQYDTDEVFRFVWENRHQLDLNDEAYTFVQSVVPCFRVDLDGFIVRETVAEYVQILHLKGSELNTAKMKRVGIRKPADMPGDEHVPLYGGGTLVFNEYGRLKFHIYNPVLGKRQAQRVNYLWRHGALRRSSGESFEQFHRARSIDLPGQSGEQW
ncbi:MAG: hypothetical protein AAF581_07730 [Planctomycetota bacterium]